MATFKKPFGGPYHRPIVFHDPSLALQSCQDECDINSIMSRWQTTGVLEHVQRFEGNYGDFISAVDYHDSMNRVLEAQDAFDSLPSSVRSRFANSPSEFLDFVQNPNNRDEMISMGLIIPESVNISTDEPEANSSLSEG